MVFSVHVCDYMYACVSGFQCVHMCFSLCVYVFICICVWFSVYVCVCACV